MCEQDLLRAWNSLADDYHSVSEFRGTHIIPDLQGKPYKMTVVEMIEGFKECY